MPKQATLGYSITFLEIQTIFSVDLTPEDNISIQEKSGTEHWIVVITSKPSSELILILPVVEDSHDYSDSRPTVPPSESSSIASLIYTVENRFYGTCTIPLLHLWSACFSINYTNLI